MKNLDIKLTKKQEQILDYLDKQFKLHTIKFSIVVLVFAVVIISCVVVFGHKLQKENQKQKQLIEKQQAIATNLPYKHIGKFHLSWYSPKELGKERPDQLRTSRGLIPKEGRTIAVDPTVIPYGSLVYIEGQGYYIAEDCGGAIRGNRIDVFTASYDYAMNRGRNGGHPVNVYLLGKL